MDEFVAERRLDISDHRVVVGLRLLGIKLLHGAAPGQEHGQGERRSPAGA